MSYLNHTKAFLFEKVEAIVSLYQQGHLYVFGAGVDKGALES
jgi:hypothetical protein